MTPAPLSPTPTACRWRPSPPPSAAPGEVHTRNAVRLLVTDLMAAPRQAAMPGLPALAARVHANT
ncbi:MAG: hypothetical protein ACRDS1_00550 [Pseudonocardiaceae bacterium]